jgi:hypothetical protein
MSDEAEVFDGEIVEADDKKEDDMDTRQVFTNDPNAEQTGAYRSDSGYEAPTGEPSEYASASGYRTHQAPPPQPQAVPSGGLSPQVRQVVVIVGGLVLVGVIAYGLHVILQKMEDNKYLRLAEGKGGEDDE